MTAIGYRFATPARVWDPEAAPVAPPLLASLRDGELPAAVAALEERVREAAAAWAWRGPPVVLPVFMPAG